MTAGRSTRGSGRAAKGRGKLDMGRPAELPDRFDPIQTPAAVDQGSRVAREGGGIARHIGDPPGIRARQLGRLLLRARSRRVEDDRLEPVELLRLERAPEQVAMIDEELAAGAARRRL